VEIMQAFAGLRAWPSGMVIMCVWITSLASLKGRAWWSGDRAGLCKSEGCGLVEIMNFCGSPAWQVLGAQTVGDHAGLRGGNLGKHGPGRTEEQGQRSKIPWPAELWLRGPMGQGLACSTSYSFSI
jgi:hypothetical protein